MTIVLKHDPAMFAAGATHRALNSAIQEFASAMSIRINQAVIDEIIPDWWNVDNMDALQTIHDNLCAIETKTKQNLLDISGLSLILLNFVDDSTLEEEGP
jgi:hypothetical protein